MVDGDQAIVMVKARDVIRPVQVLVGLEIVALAVPVVTAGPVDPAVVHPLALRVMAVDSAAVPLFVRGGENVSAPVMPVHVMLPEATAAVVVVVGAAAAALVLVLVLGLELQPVASAAIRPSATSNSGVRNVDTG
jgi:hypothetical protein